jgi:hypothetical protein
MALIYLRMFTSREGDLWAPELSGSHSTCARAMPHVSGQRVCGRVNALAGVNQV